MTIQRFYTKEITVKRLVPIEDTDKTEKKEFLVDVPCYMEKMFEFTSKLWIGNVDIVEGDEITIDDKVYSVREVVPFERADIGVIHHKEILLELKYANQS